MSWIEPCSRRIDSINRFAQCRGNQASATDSLTITARPSDWSRYVLQRMSGFEERDRLRHAVMRAAVAGCEVPAGCGKQSVRAPTIRSNARKGIPQSANALDKCSLGRVSHVGFDFLAAREPNVSPSKSPNAAIPLTHPDVPSGVFGSARGKRARCA
jgi:hypothetical protein